MIHPDTALRHVDDATGLGVFATAPIPAGTIVWLHDALDQVLDDARLAALPPLLRSQAERFAYIDGRGRRILCWDHARYMNHSCAPTTTSVGVLLEIARRDLAPGDELTCEYGLDYTTVAFDCSCGAPGCRGSLVPADPIAQRRRWDVESQAAFDLAITVAQPLLDAVSPTSPEVVYGADARAILAALRGRQRITLPSWLDGTPGA